MFERYLSVISYWMLIWCQEPKYGVSLSKGVEALYIAFYAPANTDSESPLCAFFLEVTEQAIAIVLKQHILDVNMSMIWQIADDLHAKIFDKNDIEVVRL